MSSGRTQNQYHDPGELSIESETGSLVPGISEVGHHSTMFPIIHVGNEFHQGCNKLAFYLHHLWQPGEIMYASNVVMPDGTVPAPHSQIVCGTCKKPMVIGE